MFSPSSHGVREAVEFSALPSALRSRPAGMPWLLDLLPAVSPPVVRPLAIAFVVACLLACVGWWTRAAGVAAVLLGLFVLAVPQSYSKVTHFHHLWWIAAVLAASPCGDALSVDAARRAWRRGHGESLRPPAAAASLPVRITWLLIACTYLFPGLWKYASAGWGWAFSDNLRIIMYEHWTRLEGFTPVLPIDQWPWAYQLGGAAVIVLEIGFLLLVLGRRNRALAAVAGLAFHNANLLFLRLSFATLQVTYVAFVPWSRVFAWLGHRAPIVSISADTPRRLRLVGALLALDPLGVVESDAPAGRRRERGRAAVSRMARHRVAGVAVVGVVILSANTLAGLGAVTAAWPFASYPTFAGIARRERAEPIFVLKQPDGASREIGAAELRRLVSWEKLDSMARPIFNEAPDARQRAEALLAAAEPAGLDVPAGTTVAVYRTHAVLDLRKPPPAARDLLFTIER